MSKKTSFAVREFTLGAGDEITVSRTSDFLMCLEATDTFKVAFDGDSDWDDFLAGLTFKPLTGFNKVSIYNDTGASNTIKLGFGKGDVKDSRLTLSGSIINREEVAPYFIPSAKHSWGVITHSSIVSQNMTRKEVGIKNIGPVRVWLRTAAVGGGQFGHALDPGETIILNTTAGIDGSADGINAELSVWETRY